MSELPELSLEAGEEWCWCYEDEIVFRVDFAEAGT